MRPQLVVIGLSLLIPACSIGNLQRRTPTRSVVGLEKALRARIASDSSAVVGVSIIDLESGLKLGINDTISMHAASTMKVPIMIEVFRQAERNRTSLDEMVTVRNEFTSIADGSRYSLSPADDSDSTLYRMVGGQVPLRELVRLMIVRSSNLATNILIERVTPAAVKATLAELKAEDVRVLRGVEDTPAFQQGLNNVTTAAGMARVMEGIVRCRVTSRKSCDEMIEILAAQEFNDMIPRGLPGNVKVAHKTGWITGIHHDAAIIFPNGQKPYVLVVLTKGIQDTTKSAKMGADLSGYLWDSLAGITVAGPSQRCPITVKGQPCQR
jgi:beta-lactamase class A